MTSDGYCQCGCGQKTSIVPQTDTKNGYKKGQYRKYCLGHRATTVPVEYLILDSGCWEWQRYRNKGGYGVKKIGKRVVLAHRYYYEKYTNLIPDGYEIDHICHNRACVNPEHLRLATRSQNQHHQLIRKDGVSSYKGVTWSKAHKKWEAQLVFNSQHFYLGLFETEEEAAKAYDEKAVELFGEFACLNFNRSTK